MKHKKLFSFIICVIYFVSFSAPLYAEGTANNEIKMDITAESAVIIDAKSGKTLYAMNPDKKWYPASMTKLMTLIVALETIHNNKASFEDEVITSRNAAGYGGAQLYLKEGETFSLKEMLIAVIIGSANDASVAVAEHIAGSEEAFVDLMNKKAEEIGCENTNFVNTHGLHDENHYTTAMDMAKIALYSLNYPETLEFTSLKFHKFRDDPKTERYSLNKLLWWYPGTDGFKTGTTGTAKRNLVATCKRDGLRLISVVMGAGESRGHFTETMKLFNAGFRMYSYKEFFPKGQKIGTVKVGKGSQDTVNIVTQESIGLTVLKGNEENYKTQILLPKTISAPFSQGTPAGEIIIYRDDEKIESFTPVTEVSVKKGSVFRMISKVLKGVYTL